jgi:hypothetical protein
MSGVGGLLREARRLRAEVDAVRDPNGSPAERRVMWARALYEPRHPDAYRRLAARPDDPEMIIKFLLDTFLARFGDLARLSTATAWHREFRTTLDVADGPVIRPLELDLDPSSEPVPDTNRPSVLVIPTRDERFETPHGPHKWRAYDGPLWIPCGKLGPPLLVHGREAESLKECLWAAGQANGLYVMESGDDGEDDGEPARVAVRSARGVVSTRRFAGEWEEVGTIEES